MAELLDDVVSEVSECIQCGDQLVVVEGFCRSLAEEKDSLEHPTVVLQIHVSRKAGSP